MLKFKNGDGLFFVSDEHYWHTNIIKYCKRPFKDVFEMNEFMIEQHNSVVGKNDAVFHLGDFILTNNVKQAEKILERLNGKKYICMGSHDKNLFRLLRYFEKLGESYQINVGGQLVFLNHYLHKVWPKSHHGSWHLYGHSHGGLDWYAVNEGKILDVSVDSHNFKPWSFAEVEEVMKSRPLNFNDLKRKNIKKND